MDACNNNDETDKYFMLKIVSLSDGLSAHNKRPRLKGGAVQTK